MPRLVFKRFILCLGYKREAFIDYFLNYHARSTDFTLKLGEKNGIIYHDGHGEEDWEVTLADTGNHTMTGGRVACASKYLKPEDQDFFLTYGDAVADIDVGALLTKHIDEQRLLTVTAVYPDGRFGALQVDDDSGVTAFSRETEKRRLGPSTVVSW